MFVASLTQLDLKVGHLAPVLAEQKKRKLLFLFFSDAVIRAQEEVRLRCFRQG